MKKLEYTTPQERKLKFAEAGILFVLVLALTVFIGAKVITRGGSDEVAVEETPLVDAVAVEEASVGTEDAVTVAAEHPAEIAAEPDTDAGSAIVAEPEPVVVTYGMAETAYLDGDYAGAARLFDTYTREHGANAWGHYMLGLSEWKSGDLDAAEEAFLTALEIKPDHVKSLVNYGRVLLEQDRPAEARVQLELALAADPAGIDARRVMGRIQHAAGELEEAAASYRAVLAVKDDDAWSLNNLGLIRIEQGRYDEALAPLAKASLLKPETACIQNNLGVALERTGHFGAAAEAFTAALAADEGYAKAEISLSRVEEQEAAHGSEPVDMAALAAGFTAGPVIAAEVAGTDSTTTDMEVASAAVAAETVQAADAEAATADAEAVTGTGETGSDEEGGGPADEKKDDGGSSDPKEDDGGR